MNEREKIALFVLCQLVWLNLVIEADIIGYQDLYFMTIIITVSELGVPVCSGTWGQDPTKFKQVFQPGWPIYPCHQISLLRPFK